jgi:hypothetical protein
VRTVIILCLGALALFALEVAYSLQLQRYETDKRQQAVFFRGPITVTLRAVMDRGTAATPASNRKM